jgi:hypothetical protein
MYKPRGVCAPAVLLATFTLIALYAGFAWPLPLYGLQLLCPFETTSIQAPCMPGRCLSAKTGKISRKVIFIIFI